MTVFCTTVSGGVAEGSTLRKFKVVSMLLQESSEVARLDSKIKYGVFRSNDSIRHFYRIIRCDREESQARKIGTLFYDPGGATQGGALGGGHVAHVDIFWMGR